MFPGSRDSDANQSEKATLPDDELPTCMRCRLRGALPEDGDIKDLARPRKVFSTTDAASLFGSSDLNISMNDGLLGAGAAAAAGCT